MSQLVATKAVAMFSPVWYAYLVDDIHVVEVVIRFSQPIIKGTHQWATSACPLREHRAAAVAVRQRAALRQSKLPRSEHPGSVYHVRDARAGAAVSILMFSNEYIRTPLSTAWTHAFFFLYLLPFACLSCVLVEFVCMWCCLFHVGNYIIRFQVKLIFLMVLVK